MYTPCWQGLSLRPRLTLRWEGVQGRFALSLLGYLQAGVVTMAPIADILLYVILLLTSWNQDQSGISRTAVFQTPNGGIILVGGTASFLAPIWPIVCEFILLSLTHCWTEIWLHLSREASKFKAFLLVSLPDVLWIWGQFAMEISWEKILPTTFAFLSHLLSPYYAWLRSV